MLSKEKKTHTKSGFLSYEDALIYEQAKKEELSYQNQYLKKYKITINQLFNDWMNIEAKYQYQDNTIIDYEARYKKHIQNRLGNYLVSDMNYIIIQQYFNENQHIGLATNLKIKKIINVLMNFAIKCGYCSKNPIPLIHVSGIDNARNHNQVYKESDFDLITQKLINKKTHINYVFAIALYIGKYTGLRISETFALTRDDFDFDQQIIHINKKVVYANLKKKEIYIKNQMKTKSSKSNVPFHKDLQGIILKWIKYHRHKYILSDSKGKLINLKQLNYSL